MDDDDSDDDDHHHAVFARQADPSPHQIIQRLFMNPPHLLQLLVRIKRIILIIIIDKKDDDNDSDNDDDSVNAMINMCHDDKRTTFLSKYTSMRIFIRRKASSCQYITISRLVFIDVFEDKKSTSSLLSTFLLVPARLLY